MVFWKARLAFLAMPKTGTQAYETALTPWADILFKGPPGLKHCNARRFRRDILPLIDPDREVKLATLAVVREPLEWLGSWYRYRSRPQLSGQPNSTADVSFDQFVDAYLSNDRPPFAALGSQHRFVSNKAGKIIVNHLFSYENQMGLRDFLTGRLGVSFDLPQKNTSPQRDLTLSQELNTRLHTDHAADFQLYENIRAAEA